TLSAGRQNTLHIVYDKAGNIRFTQDAQGAVVGTYNYTKYDTLSRQIEAGYLSGVWDDVQLQARADSDPAWPPTPPTWRKQYIYDGDGTTPNMIGRIMSIAANNGADGTADVTETFGHDIMGNTTSDSLMVSAYASGAEQRVDYEYDNSGNITRIVYPTDTSGA